MFLIELHLGLHASSNDGFPLCGNHPWVCSSWTGKNLQGSLPQELVEWLCHPIQTVTQAATSCTSNTPGFAPEFSIVATAVAAVTAYLADWTEHSLSLFFSLYKTFETRHNITSLILWPLLSCYLSLFVQLLHVVILSQLLSPILSIKW